MRLTFFLIPGTVLMIAGASGEDGHAAPLTNAHVTVQCTQPQLVKGLPLRVLAANSTGNELLPIGRPPVFDASGKARVGLKSGEYCFEVAAARDNGTIIVLRSDTISVPKTTLVKLVAGKPQPLRLIHERRRVKLSEVAVRSAAPTGEVRWRRKIPAVSPKLILTPGKSMGINMIGNTGPLHFAVWENVTSETEDAAIQLHTQDTWSNCRFIRRAGTPKMRRAWAVLVFPDTRMKIPIMDATRLWTNRRFVMMGYRVELIDGKRFKFDPLPYIVDRSQQFEFGGAELTPRAWAGYVTEPDKKKWWPHLFWRYDLLDPGGHRLNVAAAGCCAVGTAARIDGKKMPNGRLTHEEKKAIGNPSRAIRVKVEWTWNGRHSHELSPEPFVILRSAHFEIDAIPAWTWRSQNYLSMLERFYAIEREVTGRPGPASVNIDWRNKTHNAKATVGRPRGGQKRIWCSLPFKGYEKSADLFGSPKFVAHEMLHNFGYHHKDGMRRLQRLVTSEFSRYRWYIVDHPEIVPMIEQGIPADATKKPPMKKKVRRKKST